MAHVPHRRKVARDTNVERKLQKKTEKKCLLNEAARPPEISQTTKIQTLCLLTQMFYCFFCGFISAKQHVILDGIKY